MFSVDNVKDIVALNKDFATLEFIENPVWWPTRTGVTATKSLLYEQESIGRKINAEGLFFVPPNSICLECPLTRQPLNVNEISNATPFRDILVCATKNAIDASETIDRNNLHVREFEELEVLVNLPQRAQLAYQNNIKELFEKGENNLQGIERIVLTILKLHNLVNKNTILIVDRNNFLASIDEFIEDDIQSIENIGNEELRAEAGIYLSNIQSVEAIVKSLRVGTEELLRMNIASAEELISANQKRIARVIEKDNLLSQIDGIIALETQLSHADNQMKAEVNVSINNLRNIKMVVQNLPVESPEVFALNLQQEKRMFEENYARLLEIDKRHAVVKKIIDLNVNNQMIGTMFDAGCQLETSICLCNLGNIKQVVFGLNTHPKEIYEMNIKDAERMANELAQKLALLIEKDKVLKEMNNVIIMMQDLIIKVQLYIESEPPEHEVARANIFIANINNIIHFAKLNMNNGFEAASGNVRSLLRMNLTDIRWMDGFRVRINARKTMNEVIIRVSNLIQKARCFIATSPPHELRMKAECLIQNLNGIIKIAEANKYKYPEVAKLNIDSMLRLNAESMNWMEGVNIQMTTTIAMQVIKMEAELFIRKTESFLRTRPNSQDIVKASSLILNLRNIIHLATLNNSNSYEIAMANMKSVVDMQVEAIDWMQEQQLSPAYQQSDFGVSSRVLMFSDSLKNRKRTSELPVVTLESRAITYPF